MQLRRVRTNGGKRQQAIQIHRRRGNAGGRNEDLRRVENANATAVLASSRVVQQRKKSSSTCAFMA